MADIAETRGTIDDLIFGIGKQTAQDERQRTRDGRDRKRGEESLLTWHKNKEKAGAKDAETQRKLQGIESHMTKNNQLFNFRSWKASKNGLFAGGKGLTEIVQKFLSKAWFKDKLDKGQALQKGWKTDLKRHGALTNIWGGMRTDMSMLLGSVGAIANMPGFQTFWNVAKFLLSNIARSLFLISGLIGKLVLWPIKKLLQIFGFFKDEPDPAAKTKTKTTEVEEPKVEASWAGPLGTKSDPFYVIPINEGTKRWQKEQDEKETGPEGADADADETDTPKKKLFTGVFKTFSKSWSKLWKEIAGKFKALSGWISTAWVATLLPARKMLKAAATKLALSLKKVAKLIYVTLIPLLTNLIKVLWAFVANMIVFMFQLTVSIIGGVIKLLFKMAALAVQLTLAIAAMIVDIAMFIALNLKLVLIAVAVGLLIWVMWASWKYCESKFTEWGDRMRLFGDKLAMIWEVARSGDAIRLIGLGLKSMLYGVVEMLENTFNVVIRWWNSTRIAGKFDRLKVNEVDWGGASTMSNIRTRRADIKSKYSDRSQELVDMENAINEKSKDVTFWSIMKGGPGYGESVNPGNRQSLIQNFAGSKTSYVSSGGYGGSAALFNNNFNK